MRPFSRCSSRCSASQAEVLRISPRQAPYLISKPSVSWKGPFWASTGVFGNAHELLHRGESAEDLVYFAIAFETS